MTNFILLFFSIASTDLGGSLHQILGVYLPQGLQSPVNYKKEKKRFH